MFGQYLLKSTLNSYTGESDVSRIHTKQLPRSGVLQDRRERDCWQEHFKETDTF